MPTVAASSFGSSGDSIQAFGAAGFGVASEAGLVELDGCAAAAESDTASINAVAVTMIGPDRAR